jgi:lipoate-protein ligase A
MPIETLRISRTHASDPERQSAIEERLLCLARSGETRLHLAGMREPDTLSIGAFHRLPTGVGQLPIWQRRSGGRAFACGAAYVLATLALPHRAAPWGHDRCSLRPAQILNRAVRGLLQALREIGLEATYPGLDLVTSDRRPVAGLTFVEVGDPTLVEMILAVEEPLAQTLGLLDRADPEGVIPADLPSLLPSCAIAEATPGAPGASDLEAWSDLLARGLAGEFSCDLIDEGDDDPPVPDAPGDSPARTGESARAGRQNAATGPGRLGPIEARCDVADAKVSRFELSGNFIAPEEAPSMLTAYLEGCAATPEAVGETLRGVLDDDRMYFLGLLPDELVELAGRCATIQG